MPLYRCIRIIYPAEPEVVPEATASIPSSETSDEPSGMITEIDGFKIEELDVDIDEIDGFEISAFAEEVTPLLSLGFC